MTTQRRGYLTTIEAWEYSEGAAAPMGVIWVEEQQSYNFALFMAGRVR